MDILYYCDLAKQSAIESVDHPLNALTVSLLSDIRKAILQQEFPSPADNQKLSPSEIQEQLDEANRLTQKGLLRTTELILIGILEFNPFCEAAIQQLAELNEQEAAYTKTISYANYLLDKGVANEEIIYQLTFALYRLGRHDEALEAILSLYICSPSARILRLCGLILKSLGKWNDAIEVLSRAIKESPRDIFSIRALSELHADRGFYQKSLETRNLIPSDLVDNNDKLCEAIVLRMMGNLEAAIQLNSEIIAGTPGFSNALWTQCFNYSIASSEWASKLLETSQQFWQLKKQSEPSPPTIKLNPRVIEGERLRIAFISSDIGEHVVSRFLVPILRHYDRDKYHVTLLSTHRRFEEKASEIVTYTDSAISLQGLNVEQIYASVEATKSHVIIETNGFTRNSGIGILTQRCAPVQCHYIGYHATTGLSTIDYFLGDAVTVPCEFQAHYTEKLVQIPSLWMAYDVTIPFPTASSSAQRESPVLGSFSQVAKINRQTLEFWAAAMNAVPDSILVIKDRGCYCNSVCKRIEETFQTLGIDQDRIYFIAPVSSHLDHLDSYKAIDIALDTTPWSSATTAFEALGMGVPLVAIWGDTTSGRMSSSVVSAAGMSHLIAHSKEEFARLVSELSKDYKQLRNDKAAMQKRIRSGILFDEQRICRDFFATIDKLAVYHELTN